MDFATLVATRSLAVAALQKNVSFQIAPRAIGEASSEPEPQKEEPNLEGDQGKGGQRKKPSPPSESAWFSGVESCLGSWEESASRGFASRTLA